MEKLDDGELAHLHADYWVDLCHGGGMMIDERYYLSSLAAALEFYRERMDTAAVLR